MTTLFPDPFLSKRYVDKDGDPFVICLCAGYQSKSWRAKQFADHLFSWIPHVALSEDERVRFNLSNWEEMISLAAAKVYKTKKTASRGEIGEIILHAACLQYLKAEPMVCKLVLKTSSNDTVKGFDGVHLLRGDAGDFNLLLGESKFYGDPRRGIREAIKSLKEHVVEHFLDTEKAMLLSHIPSHLRSDDELVSLFRKTTSSDDLLAKSIFPVLVGYESQSVNLNTELSDTYKSQVVREVEDLRDYFNERIRGSKFPKIILIFVPMAKKKLLIDRFDQKIRAYQ